MEPSGNGGIKPIFQYTDIKGKYLQIPILIPIGRVCVVCFTIATKIYRRGFIPESVASQHPTNSLKIKI